MGDSLNLRDFPKLAGCYLMKDRAGNVIYVGKAKNLRSRLKSYFGKGGDERPQIPYLLQEVSTIETIVVTSEKEALLLENTLIKRYKPKYNVLLKDDKSYLGIKISNHPFGQISLVRYKGRPPRDGGKYFGPYAFATKARNIFDLVVALFPLRQCSDSEFARRKRPCLLYDIKRCPGPCVGLCSVQEYQESVARCEELLTGDKKAVIEKLTKQMEGYSAKLQFESANGTLKKIRLVEDFFEQQRVANIKSPDCDAIGMARHGQVVILSKLSWRDGKLIGSKNFEFPSVIEDDEEVIESFLLQHYLKEGEDLPHIILVAMKLPHGKLLEEILGEQKRAVGLHFPERGEKRQLLGLANLNATTVLQQKKQARESLQKGLLDLQEILHLERYPRRIECFDQSHLAGTSFVASMVVFQEGQKKKESYRHYHVKAARPGDDYGALKEVMERRYKKAKEENNLPDLIMIDGGKGHLHTARGVLDEQNIATCDLIAIAKEEGRHDKGLTCEVVHTEKGEAVRLDPRSPLLRLLQAIRDEAHRFAISLHTTTRRKTLFTSELDRIEGIGAAKKMRLLQTFGSVKAIGQKTVEELVAVKGITRALAIKILELVANKSN